jgi:hypothetical protein
MSVVHMMLLGLLVVRFRLPSVQSRFQPTLRVRNALDRGVLVGTLWFFFTEVCFLFYFY